MGVCNFTCGALRNYGCGSVLLCSSTHSISGVSLDQRRVTENQPLVFALIMDTWVCLFRDYRHSPLFSPDTASAAILHTARTTALGADHSRTHSVCSVLPDILSRERLSTMGRSASASSDTDGKLKCAPILRIEPDYKETGTNAIFVEQLHKSVGSA